MFKRLKDYKGWEVWKTSIDNEIRYYMVSPSGIMFREHYSRSLGGIKRMIDNRA